MRCSTRSSRQAPVNLVGHSLGGNVAALYAGARPERVARFVNLEGFGMAPTRAEQAPKRYARWLEELRDPPGLRPYESFSALAERLQARQPAAVEGPGGVPRAALGPGSRGRRA